MSSNSEDAVKESSPCGELITLKPFKGSHFFDRRSLLDKLGQTLGSLGSTPVNSLTHIDIIKGQEVIRKGNCTSVFPINAVKISRRPFLPLN